MVLSFFKKIFGGSSAKPAASSGRAASTGGEPDLSGFVEFVVRALVDNPSAVKVTKEEGERGLVIRIACEKSDIGKVIGKSGKTIASIRSLVHGAAGGRSSGRQVDVEVLD